MFSRRSFLKIVGAAAAVLALPIKYAWGKIVGTDALDHFAEQLLYQGNMIVSNVVIQGRFKNEIT